MSTPLRNSRRRRRDALPIRRVVGRALGVAIFLGVLLWIAVTAYNGVPLRSYRTMYLSVPETGNLLQHDQVRIAGVRVGQVRSTSIQPDGRARITVQLEPGTKVPAGTRVLIRANGLLGARYIQLIPGHSAQYLADGTTIQGGPHSLTYGVPEALDVFNQQTRGALGTTIRGLGTGLLGHGQGLNQTLHLAGQQIVPFQETVKTILSRPGAAARLLPSLDQLSTPLAAAAADYSQMFAPAAKALAPFADQRAATEATLARAPGALQAANAGLANGERLLAAVDQLSIQAARTLPTAPRGLKATTTLLRTSHEPLVQAAALLRAAKPAVPAAVRITSALNPILGPVDKGLATATPIATQVGPYGCNLENFGAVLRSLTGFGGLGDGPGGPSIAFRLIALPSVPTETLGVRDVTGMVKRDSYYGPCKYLASKYPTDLQPLAGVGK